jgi:uncharacterized membrane protein YhaH (DUF805 family)
MNNPTSKYASYRSWLTIVGCILLGLLALARAGAALTLLLTGGKGFSTENAPPEWQVVAVGVFGLVVSLIGVIAVVAMLRDSPDRWTFALLFLVLFPILGILNGLVFFGRLVPPDIPINSLIAVVVGALLWTGQRTKTARIQE